MSIDLGTQYLGLHLRNPLVVASCPLCAEIYKLQQLEEAGAAAAVLPSLFEEQIRHEDDRLTNLLCPAPGAARENLSYVPGMDEYNSGPDSYLRYLEAAKRAVSIPIIASLNGHLAGGWTRFARLIQEAGADALELNIYFLAVDPGTPSYHIEEQYLDLVRAVRQEVTIPLAVKIGPYFSSLPDMCRQLVEAGANGLVLFNRFLQPDLDLNTFELRPALHLSHRNELQLRLRWISILRGQLSVSLAATGGAHVAADVLKLLLAGADVAMLASALMRHGPSYLEILLTEMSAWIEQKGFISVQAMKGTVCQRYAECLAAYERRNYIATVTSLARGAKPESSDVPVEFANRSGRQAVESPATTAADPEENLV